TDPADKDRLRPLNPANPAYVIYTSGSTGRPKGAVIKHQNVISLIRGCDSKFEFRADDTWSFFHSYAFDFSVWEIWGALLHGAKVVVIPYLTTRSPREVLAILEAEQVTILNQTPSAFYQLLSTIQEAESEWTPRLRYIIFGGEALDIWRLKPWFSSGRNHETRFVNMYGITETTVHVSYYEVLSDQVETASGSLIGAGIPNVRIYVLDDHLCPVPAGVGGELYIAGSGLARG
ncbi:AMP-binding protein, partial [Agrobacterium rhizogenes]